MEARIIPAMLICLLALAAGCKPADDSANVSKTDDPQAAHTKSDAPQSASDYAYSQKTEFVNKMNTEISSLKAQTSELETKVESTTGTTKEELRARIELLRQKVDQLTNQLNKVKDSNAGTWNEVRSALQKGADVAKESFKQARQWLSDKIKP